MQRRRIMVVTGYLDRSGLALYVAELSRSLASIGHEVLVCTVRSPGAQDLQLDASYTVRKVARLSMAVLRRVLADFRPDWITLATGGFPPDTRITVPLLLLTRCPIIETIHAESRRWRVGLGRHVFYRVRPKRRYRLAIFSPRIAEAIRYHIPELSNQVIEVPPGIGLPDSVPVTRGSRADGEFRLASVGRLSELTKDFATLVRAFAIVRHNAPAGMEPTLDIYGEGPDRPHLEALATELGLAGSVRFRGWCTEIYESLSNHDLFVMSTRTESFGRVNIEAAACGLAVVASDVPGNRISVADGNNGLLVPAGDPQAMANAVLRIMGNRVLHATLAAAGPGHAAQFRIEHHARKLAEIADGMLA